MSPAPDRTQISMDLSSAGISTRMKLLAARNWLCATIEMQCLRTSMIPLRASTGLAISSGRERYFQYRVLLTQKTFKLLLGTLDWYSVRRLRVTLRLRVSIRNDCSL